jgi:signal transduction histidine kinase
MTTTLMEATTLSESAAQLLKNVPTHCLAVRATRVLALTTALAEAETVSDVADVLLGIGLDALDAACGVVGRAEHGRIQMIRAAGRDEVTRARALAASLCDPAPLTQSVASGRPVYLSSVEEFRRRYPWAYSRLAAVGATQAHAALPLIHRGAVVGGVALGFAKPTTFGAADRALVVLLAQAAAGALARAAQSDAERASRRDCEVLVRARAEALGVVAHDLRNPLSLIRLTAELLLEEDLPRQQRQQLLQSSIRAVTQMSRLIDDLLGVAQIQSGRLRLDVEPVVLKDVVAQIDEAFRPLAAEQGIAWEACADDAAIIVHVDTSRVLQAVGNLVGNALKFTPRGGRVSVRATATAQHLVIAVRDTGPGIPPAAMAHLFEGFWQAKTDPRGVGLGLTIAKGIAEAHGGRIDVKTTQGRGSTFLLTLPL